MLPAFSLNPNQVSFSDDELEYTTAHRTSNHGAEGGSRANSVHEGSGAGDDDDEREEDEEAHEVIRAWGDWAFCAQDEWSVFGEGA